MCSLFRLDDGCKGSGVGGTADRFAERVSVGLSWLRLRRPYTTQSVDMSALHSSSKASAAVELETTLQPTIDNPSSRYGYRARCGVRQGKYASFRAARN